MLMVKKTTLKHQKLKKKYTVSVSKGIDIKQTTARLTGARTCFMESLSRKVAV